MKTIIDTRSNVQSAADLIQFFEEIAALGYDLDTLHLHTKDGDLDKLTFEQERLSDGSLVWNVAIS